MKTDRAPASLSLEEWAELGLQRAQKPLEKQEASQVQEEVKSEEEVPPAGMPKSFWQSLGVGSN